eukprot:NODE_6761_length_539_cov_2.075510_g6337_i0.p2 GENE.NODE_6761_length_539_cov_2.075510_g6337_i0~~NODE_6761_length_539_cov_2.075510_g6337_i0.p2  ORF type:complete len:115 (+),score=7.54 NODE_6761_length_539_cov_2.075510_g6337_i0:182-526(+)
MSVPRVASPASRSNSVPSRASTGRSPTPGFTASSRSGRLSSSSFTRDHPTTPNQAARTTAASRSRSKSKATPGSNVSGGSIVRKAAASAASNTPQRGTWSMSTANSRRSSTRFA